MRLYPVKWRDKGIPALHITAHVFLLDNVSTLFCSLDRLFAGFYCQLQVLTNFLQAQHWTVCNLLY